MSVTVNLCEVCALVTSQKIITRTDKIKKKECKVKFIPVLNQATRLEDVREYIQKFPNWPPGARTANGRAFCH
jgi:hypothetical protein